MAVSGFSFFRSARHWTIVAHQASYMKISRSQSMCVYSCKRPEGSASKVYQLGENCSLAGNHKLWKNYRCLCSGANLKKENLITESVGRHVSLGKDNDQEDTARLEKSGQIPSTIFEEAFQPHAHGMILEDG